MKISLNSNGQKLKHIQRSIKHPGRVIKGPKILAEIKECNSGTKTRHGKQTHTPKNKKKTNIIDIKLRK